MRWGSRKCSIKSRINTIQFYRIIKFKILCITMDKNSKYSILFMHSGINEGENKSLPILLRKWNTSTSLIIWRHIFLLQESKNIKIFFPILFSTIFLFILDINVSMWQEIWKYKDTKCNMLVLNHVSNLVKYHATITEHWLTLIKKNKPFDQNF